MTPNKRIMVMLPPELEEKALRAATHRSVLQDVLLRDHPHDV